MTEPHWEWIEAELGDITSFVMGQAPPGSASNFNGLGTPFVKAGEFGEDRPFIKEWTTLPLKIARSTDVLICVVGATSGKINLGADCAIGRSVAAIRPGERLEQRYLYYFLKTQVLDLRRGVSGSAQGVISKETLSKIRLPLPPLPEQRRIVAKLDSLFSRSKSARENLARVPRLIERYKEAMLTAAFSGQLTVQWRKERGLSAGIYTRLVREEPYQQIFRAPQDWLQNSIESICELIGGSQPAKATFRYQPQKGFIRLIQIRDYKSDERATYIPVELARRFCTREDVMIGRYGPPIFQILRGIEGAYNVALMKAVPRSGCSSEFLFYRLQDPALRRYVEMGSDRTAGQDGVNKTHLLKYPIFMPSEEEQCEIVLRIKECFKAIERLASESDRAKKLIERLDQAALSAAFCGKLFKKDSPQIKVAA